MKNVSTTFWCVVVHFGVSGLYFFDENDVKMKVNSQHYVPISQTRTSRPDARNKHEKFLVPIEWCHSVHCTYIFNKKIKFNKR